MLGLSVDKESQQLYMHADIEGIRTMITILRRLEKHLEADDCPHAHLFSDDWSGDGDLGDFRLDEGDQGLPTMIHHFKMYGWNEEWTTSHFESPDGR